MPLTLLVMSVVTNVIAPDGNAPRALVTARVHHLLTAPNRHVRTFDRRVTAALFDGARRSETFRELLASLDGSDVIAYIEQSHDLPATVHGHLVLAATSGSFRYVRIRIRSMQAPDELIAIIGHELRHALEIAQAPEIQDEASMRAHYERAGTGRSHDLGFETREAQDAGRRVRFELRKAVNPIS
jgi:hypothetical protein